MIAVIFFTKLMDHIKGVMNYESYDWYCIQRRESPHYQKR